MSGRRRYCLSEVPDVSEIDRDIEQWTRILKESQDYTPHTESQLVRFLLVYICSKYERIVDSLIKERAKKSGDRPLASYVNEAYKMRREPRWKYLQDDVLGKFGTQQRECFKTNVKDQVKANYDSLIVNRNNSAHGLPVNATIKDITSWHQDAKNVLRAFEKALNLPDNAGAQGVVANGRQECSKADRGGGSVAGRRW